MPDAADEYPPPSPKKSKPFDHSLRRLIEESPRAFLTLFGLPTGIRMEAVDADLSPAPSEADRVLRVVRRGAPTYLLHVEIQVSRDKDMPARMLEYNVRLYRRHRQLVVSVLLLLRRNADHATFTGQLRIEDPTQTGDALHDFRYQVLRLWEMPVETLLAGDPFLLPLAILSDESGSGGDARVRAVMQAVQNRVVQPDVTHAVGAEILAVMGTILGVRYNGKKLEAMLRYMLKLESWVRESSYHKLLQEQYMKEGLEKGLEAGREEASRSLILTLGRKRLGEPTQETLIALNGLTDATRLQEMAAHLLEYESWDDLPLDNSR